MESGWNPVNSAGILPEFLDSVGFLRNSWIPAGISGGMRSIEDLNEHVQNDNVLIPIKSTETAFVLLYWFL
jgi:hypothetical protein